MRRSPCIDSDIFGLQPHYEDLDNLSILCQLFCYLLQVIGLAFIQSTHGDGVCSISIWWWRNEDTAQLRFHASSIVHVIRRVLSLFHLCASPFSIFQCSDLSCLHAQHQHNARSTCELSLPKKEFSENLALFGEKVVAKKFEMICFFCNGATNKLHHHEQQSCSFTPKIPFPLVTTM